LLPSTRYEPFEQTTFTGGGLVSDVMTVLGPVQGSDLGITLPHEHLLLDLFKVFQPHREFLINDPTLAARELQQFADAGGGALVELTTPDLGRDPEGLVHIARQTGIHIIMGMGRYREPFYEPELTRMSTRELAQLFINEIEHGVNGVKPGIIGEIGTHNPWVSPAEERVFRAAARAHNATGLTITLHANASAVGLAQLDILEEEGVDLRRVVVGHCDTHPFSDYHRALLRRGAWVEFDTIRGNFEFETERQLEQLRVLIDEAHIDRLLLSQDMAVNRFYTVYGGTGYAYLITGFVERMLAAGLSREQIDLMLVENPRRMLTGTD
jgi:predicted metal-dependent phosphotriesterase family hydrolase